MKKFVISKMKLEQKQVIMENWKLKKNKKTQKNSKFIVFFWVNNAICRSKELKIVLKLTKTVINGHCI
jgi:hypothetical protein